MVQPRKWTGEPARFRQTPRGMCQNSTPDRREQGLRFGRQDSFGLGCDSVVWKDPGELPHCSRPEAAFAARQSLRGSFAKYLDPHRLRYVTLIFNPQLSLRAVAAKSQFHPSAVRISLTFQLQGLCFHAERAEQRGDGLIGNGGWPVSDHANPWLAGC